MKSVFFAVILMFVVILSYQQVDSKIWKRRHHHEFQHRGNVHHNITKEEKGERRVNTVPMNSGGLHRKFPDTPGGERRFSMFSQANAEPCQEGYRRDGAGSCRPVWNE